MFPDIAVQSMWMPDMQFPLDIVWLDEQLVVVHRTLGAPPCASKAECSSYSSKFRIKYAIELNAGDADALGLDVGTVLRVA